MLLLFKKFLFFISLSKPIVLWLKLVLINSSLCIIAVAPICYAHLAAAQMAQFIKFDELSETSSSHGGLTITGAPQVPQLPRLHQDVTNSMFFC